MRIIYITTNSIIIWTTFENMPNLSFKEQWVLIEKWRACGYLQNSYYYILIIKYKRSKSDYRNYIIG